MSRMDDPLNDQALDQSDDVDDTGRQTEAAYEGETDDDEPADDFDETAIPRPTLRLEGAGVVAQILAVGSALHIVAVLWSARGLQDVGGIWVRLMLAAGGTLVSCVVLLVAAVLISARKAVGPASDPQVSRAAALVGVVATAAAALHVLALGITFQQSPLTGTVQQWPYRGTFLLAALVAASAFYLVTGTRERAQPGN